MVCSKSVSTLSATLLQQWAFDPFTNVRQTSGPFIDEKTEV